MWIFGYGSLMWSGWECEFGCVRRLTAKLRGYRRVFNKPSLVRWGTNATPCPTLNLTPDDQGSCIGIAFEFPESDKVVAYLRKREGRDFPLVEVTVEIEGVPRTARTPIFSGQGMSESKLDLVTSIRSAAGTGGLCLDYVSNIHSQLASMGIDEPEVTELWQLLNS